MKIIHTLSLAVALALPLAAISASAQQEPQKEPAKSADAVKQSYGVNDYIRQPVRIDKTFNQSLEGGCKYTVTVSGTITPNAHQKNAKVPIVTPHLDVASQAVCPNEASVKVTDNVLGSGPLTWGQLQDSLSNRSRVFTVENDHQCTYAADFKLVNAKLELDHFAHACKAI